MKTMLYYFSATGNSLYVARSLAEKIDDCRLISIPRLLQSKTVFADAEVVGLVFPTHYFGLPPIVSEFIGKLNLDKAKFIFSIVTSGSSPYVSSTLHQVDTLFSKMERRLDAGFHVEMISSYIPLSDIPAIAKVNKKLSDAELKVQQIVKDVLARKKTRETERLWVPFNAINKYWKSNLLPQTHGKFTCKSSCTSCGTCEKVCPVQNIRLYNGRPQWSDNCQECLACLHFCPAESIEFGSRTAGKKRYHHPQVSAIDIANSK